MKKSVKNLSEITEQEAKHISVLVGERFSEFISHQQYNFEGLSRIIKMKKSSTLFIYNDGRISLFWEEWRVYPTINAMLVTDYLKEQGYVFKKNIVLKKKLYGKIKSKRQQENKKPYG
jgi:hypothetical protein